MTVYQRPGNLGSIGFGFSKGTKASVAPSPGINSADQQLIQQLELMRQDLRELRSTPASSEKASDLEELRAEIASLKAQAAQASPAAQVAAKEIAQQIEQVSAPVREQKRIMENLLIHTSEASEAEVAGSGGKNVRELLTSPGAAKYARSSVKPGSNLEAKHFENLMQYVPPNFDEAKYLAKHPDVAASVRKGVMPSGLWHYVMYGRKEGRGLGTWDLTSKSTLMLAAAAALGYYFLIYKK